MLFEVPPGKEFENNIKIFTFHLNWEKSYSLKLHSTSINKLRKNIKTVNDDYEEYLKKFYDETTYRKDYIYDEVLLLLEEVFKGTTIEKIRKIMKELIVANHDIKNGEDSPSNSSHQVLITYFTKELLYCFDKLLYYD